MSWSVSASGTKQAVAAEIDRQTESSVANGYMTEAQREALKASVDALPGSNASVSASGHNDADKGYASLSLNGSTPPAETQQQQQTEQTQQQ